MWPDNETYIDLLGFEFLVDELEVILTNERLLPVTVGVSGDWGSGKSSLMGMARERLESGENAGRFICVSFSPWRFEDFNHAKVALMATVVDAIYDYAEERNGKLAGAVEKAKGLKDTIHRLGLIRYGTEIGATAAGLGPEEAKAAGNAADVVTAPREDPDPIRTFESVAHFHAQFEELIDELGGEVQAVVVFIDDMDRCSTPTIVETFEAMRLFMHAPKTAYVVGAHEEIVEAALEGRYPARREGDEKLGRNYLEKMLQNTIAVPPLAEPEVLTYITLLFAERHASDVDYEKLCARAAANRAENQLAVAMNEGIARDTIDNVGDELAKGFAIAALVGPPLARGLRGNPRQIKRFLNRLLVRLATAEKRKMKLDPDKLAKLMVLEELYEDHFERIFIWQLEEESGAPSELGNAERHAKGEEPDDLTPEIEEWVAQPGVREWLTMEPSLAGVSLGPYYTFSRDRLSTAITASRLPAELQQLLGDLQSATDPIRANGVKRAGELEDQQRSDLLPALMEAAARDTSSPALRSLIELASAHDAVKTTVFGWLDKLPVDAFSGNLVLRMSTSLTGDDRLRPILEQLAKNASGDAKRQAERALEKV